MMGKKSDEHNLILNKTQRNVWFYQIKKLTLHSNCSFMNANEKTLTLFTTRVRQLILQYDEKKREINALQEKLKKRESQIKELEAKLSQMQNDYTSLKMAKMIEISDGDMEDAQKRLSELIRDVNKCITLLSEKQ